MGVPDPDQMLPHREAAVAAAESHGVRELDLQSSKTHLFSSLGRQSSIYSLTLDEFQHALCESGKSFGSLNMDEFLSNIWTVEENQAINSSGRVGNNNGNAVDHRGHVSGDVSCAEGSVKETSLSRQGSLTLPDALCRKTVDEVWSEIHKSQQSSQQASNVQNPDSAARQPTFGEMTLEDFLIKAGVVREQYTAPPATQKKQQQYEVFQNSNSAVGTNFVSRMMIGTGGLGSGPGGAYQAMMGQEASGYVNGKRNSGYRPVPPPVSYAPRMGNGGGGSGNGYGPAQPMGMGGPPVSPVTSDGIGAGLVDSVELDMAGIRARKRSMDGGPVDKVVERRQRRMIKNRESAARSRARKQAYTVELEAELNELKEENAHLKQALAELERKRKQQYFEELRLKAQNKANRARERLRTMRRNSSCPL